MLKTLTAIAALAALLAFNITPAQAALGPNGGGENGITQNGGGNNGGGANGGGENGITQNGGGTNGGGANGGGSNGSATESSTLSIQAFELPAETR